VAYLALFFGEQLSLAFLPPLEFASFRADGERYRDVEAGHFVAHYDRLCDENGTLAGIQLWANPEEAGLGRLLDQLSPREYLEPLGGSPPVYRVHLAGSVSGDLTDKGDQAFGGQIFRSDQGRVALTIDLDYLCGGAGEAAEAAEAADLTVIRRAKASWVKLSEMVESPAREP
jgi:hypothetical protein